MSVCLCVCARPECFNGWFLLWGGLEWGGGGGGGW